jgi:class 3 adenylate cyclase
MRKIVLVFDICSSTVMIENLVQNDRVADYVRLIDGYWAFLNSKRDHYSFTIYKFLGDGFILLFENRELLDDVVNFFNELARFSREVLMWFRKTYLDLTALPREGITAAVAVGRIAKMKTQNMSQKEYVGRPINVACRLQGKMEELRHVGKLLMQAEAYRMISNHIYRKACKETTRSLKYISNAAEMRCYEYDAEIYLNRDWKRLHSPSTVTRQALADAETTAIRNVDLANITKTVLELITALKER